MAVSKWVETGRLAFEIVSAMARSLTAKEGAQFVGNGWENGGEAAAAPRRDNPFEVLINVKFGGTKELQRMASPLF